MFTYKVRLFAELKDRVNSEFWIHISERALKAQELVMELAKEYPQLAALSKVMRLAVNEEFVDGTFHLKDGDDIAFIPPVSGG